LDEILGGRFLVGLGIGVNAVLVPIYISEVLIDININFVINSYSPIIIG
jgi:cyanate permease